ncbi:MAG: pyridoxal phosphate-dependent aminotransferase [Patescibacteria group bacterium]|jgi:aspartate/methionine/tyrosine aminotransferase
MPEIFKTRRPRALNEAIEIAPRDLTDRKELTSISDRTIQRMLKVNLNPGSVIKELFPLRFDEMYEATTGLLKDRAEKESFNRYLVSTATTFAANLMLNTFSEQAKETREQTLERLKLQTEQFHMYQYLSAHFLLQELRINKPKSKSKSRSEIEEKIINKLRHEVGRYTIEEVSKSVSEHFIGKPATSKALTMLMKGVVQEDEKTDKFIQEAVKKGREGFSKNPKIRFMTNVFNEVGKFCAKKGIENPLLNLTLGDVSGLGMPDEVAEALALNPIGPKGLLLAARAKMYEQLAYLNGKPTDPHGYDPNALGWQGLRNRFIDYGREMGLYKDNNPATESIIGAGGAQALYKTYKILDKYFEGTKQKENGPIEAYFANPAFRMVGAKASEAGLKLIEKPTTAENNFLPDLDEVDAYFTANPQCKVFIFVPISNPSTHIAQKEYVKELLIRLKKHDAVLVNDMAYLGTGDLKANKELTKVLNTYKKRVDVYSMSKIFGRPGIRCGCAVTTDESIKEYFVPGGQENQLAEPYPVQDEAMALWDLVGQEDRNLLNDQYKKQQIRVINMLRKIDEERQKAGKITLFDWKKRIFAEAGLYAYLPLNTKKGVDGFTIIEEAHLVGTPDGAFYKPGLPDNGYIRFALGLEEILD